MAFAFRLAQAMNESAAGFIGTVDAYQFASDDLNVCTNEMNYGIVSEAADYQHIRVSGDDIMAETAITDPGRLDTLSESVFDNLKKKAEAFIKKIIAFVSGIIDKLKAAFYKLAGKTSKWCTLMEPKLRKITGAADFKVEMYPYDRAYITSGLSDNISKLFEAWVSEKVYSGEDLKKYKIDKGNEASQHTGDEGTHANVIKDLEDGAERLKSEVETFNDNWPGKLAGIIVGDGSASSIDAVWSDVTKKARGGESSKTSQAIFSDWGSMFNTIRDSSKTLDNIKKIYDAHLKNLHKVQSDLEKVGSDLKIPNETKDPKVPGDVATAFRSLVSAKFDRMIAITSAYETAASTARQTNINLMNQMVGDYMGALNKLAGFKAEKK